MCLRWGRIDFGALAVFDDFWTSDNTDALDRLEIHRAYSLVYPPKAMRAWVTDVPNFLSQRSIPLQFRFHSAMFGSLGVGCDLSTMSDDELAQCAKYVEEYKALRPLMDQFHRLENPSRNDYRLFQYSSQSGAVLFAFLPQSRLGHTSTTVRLRGAGALGRYRFTHDWQQREASGQYLMSRGIRLWMQGTTRARSSGSTVSGTDHKMPGMIRWRTLWRVLVVAGVVLTQPGLPRVPCPATRQGERPGQQCPARSDQADSQQRHQHGRVDRVANDAVGPVLDEFAGAARFGVGAQGPTESRQ